MCLPRQSAENGKYMQSVWLGQHGAVVIVSDL